MHHFATVTDQKIEIYAHDVIKHDIKIKKEHNTNNFLFIILLNYHFSFSLHPPPEVVYNDNYPNEYV